MTYVPPTITAAGLTIPAYTDIRDALLASFRSIYGQDVYLGTDSADYQWISAVALKAYDDMLVAQLAYNNQSPQTAIGAGLDSIIKLNGIKRLVATFSTCQATLTGAIGTVITGGVVQDTVFNFNWNLPTTTIPGTGSIVVTAVCQQPGAVNIQAHQLTQIVTPTAGWTGVDNVSASVPGQPIEVDSKLRSRQGISVALPSRTLVAGTLAGIAAVAGVTRYALDENNTSTTNANGTPGHSITAVAEGGTDLDVATAIFLNRGIGCGTNGTTTVSITDPLTGITLPISFDRPTSVPIFVTVHATYLPGGNANTQSAMQQALLNYLNSLQIGEVVSYGALINVAMSVNPNIAAPIIALHSLTFGTTVTPTTTTDIQLAFNQVALGVGGNVIINVP